MGKCMKMNKKILCFVAIVASFFATNILAATGKISVAKAFFELARQNNTQKIEGLLHRGYSLESLDERGYNAVCLSVIKQDKIAYRTLTSYGAKEKPNCLKKIPESAYNRFFGTYPKKTAVPEYRPDEPYKIGAMALGAGAVVAAIALKGSTSGGSGDSGDSNTPSNPDKPNEPDKPVNPDEPVTPTCPENSSYNKVTKKCECNPGYALHGNDGKCYANIPNCADQNKDICNRCEDQYLLYENRCYLNIENCDIQAGPVCNKCDAGYGTHNGDGKVCYRDIEYCDIQNKDECKQCISGYGTHGNSHKCYKNVEHCQNQVQELCKQCETGYNTYGNPYKCYSKNPCGSYPHTVPLNDGNDTCVCDENRGYTGEKESCTRSSNEEYQEGDGSKELWNDDNARYCNSHGTYSVDNNGNGMCLCYEGYQNAGGLAIGCSECAEGYSDEFGTSGLCFRIMKCEDKGEGLVQVNNTCECTEGYLTYFDDKADMKCGLIEGECATNHEEHYWNTDTQKVDCKCKPNYNKECTECIKGFQMNEDGDCVYIEKECPGGEGWVGENCDICPSQFKETVDADGTIHCKDCADNYKDGPAGKCSACNTENGFALDDLTGGCIKNGCSTGEPGYEYDDNGYCVCAEGYFRNKIGVCQKKEPDYVGTYKNVNNTSINMVNDGILRDIYGMKPIIFDENGKELKDENGNTVYYDSVYNAQAISSSQNASIEIKNNNSGENNIYGIYSDSTIYNASVNNMTDDNLSATATIKIEDKYSDSTIYGLYNLGEKTTYNAFSYSENENTYDEPSQSNSTASIVINKDKNSSGDVTGIYAGENIYNSAAISSNGTGANVSSNGVLDIKNEGNGDATGIYGTANDVNIVNAIAYMDSAVSSVLAEGSINVNSFANAYGIKANSTVINSETQFKKQYNKIGDVFESIGRITSTSDSASAQKSAYGIYIENGSDIKTDVYNAMGYNAQGIITVNSKQGSNAYGIYSNAKIYQENTGGKLEAYYNNVYNAFRSSSIYGGEDIFANGEITLNIDGNSGRGREAIGIYSMSNVFNSYANSGSNVQLNTIGTININDSSTTSDIVLKGIEGRGNLLANAYAEGDNKNTKTKAVGNINITTKSNKNGQQDKIYGMYNGAPVSQVSYIYNAAVINDNSSAEGKINIKSEKYAVNEIYGIYASNDDNQTGDGTGTEKIIYNAYYSNEDNTKSGGNVLGEINIKNNKVSSGAGVKYYGMYIKDGYAYNASSTKNTANVIGKINVDVVGGHTGEAVGMYGINSTLDNSGNSEIQVSVQAANNKAYGIYGQNSQIYNNALINVSSKEYDAYGIYADKGTVVNDENGIIKVKGKNNAYGIYAVSGEVEGEDVSVINKGTIELNGSSNNIGIYASGPKATVENANTGIIKINGTNNKIICDNDPNCDKNVAIKLENGATLMQAGTLSTDGSLNFADIGGNVVLSQGGKFIAEENISGDLQVSDNTVANTFDDKTILKGALSAKNIDELNVNSNSYMYKASTVQNDNNTYDVVMSMKDLSSITDADTAAYYQLNYDNQKNVELFNTLKKASTQSQYNQLEADVSGKSVIPNITQEELKVARSLDSKMMSELFTKKNDNVRKMVGADNMYVGRDDMDTLSGYDIMSQSMYALYDQKLDNNYRLGLGLSFTHTDTDYNNDSTRKNFMVQGYVPLTYTNTRGLTAVSMARLGYSDGDYRRQSDGRVYEADTNAITYGLLNELRYTITSKGIKITPFVGLNAIGWYQDKINEGNDALALNIGSSHIFSLESALGLYFDKDIEFSHDNKLNVALGIGYYHEFADPYKGLEADINNTLGGYKLRHSKLDRRDRGVISAKVNYNYKDFSIYGELMQYLEKEYPIKVDVGLKYNF